MNAVHVPYRSTRPLHGRSRHPRTLQGLAGSSKKRNWDAFNAAYPGTVVNSSGNYVLPAKFGGAVINQGQLDDLSGTWYGATYHPDGDQAGWKTKFDTALKSIGAYNAFYGIALAVPVQPTQIVAPLPGVTPITPFVPAPTLPVLTIQPLPVPVAISQPTTLPAVGVTPPIVVNAPATVAPDQTAAYIQQLMQQGASQKQAFDAAMQSLAAQGVNTSTPAVQQQVASDVQAASSPQQAGVYYLAAGAAALILFGVVMSNRKKSRRR